MKRLSSNQTTMFTSLNILLVCTAITTALITGLLYGYSVSVNPGLGSLPGQGYIAAMQSINRAIQNPLFFISFIGTALLLPVCTYAHYHNPASSKFYLLLAASIFYLGGVLGITMFGNVPLNNALDKFNLAAADSTEIAKQQLAFVKQWNRFHTIRTLMSCCSLLLVLIAGIMYKETD